MSHYGHVNTGDLEAMDPTIDDDNDYLDDVWVCQVCGYECDPDIVGEKCRSCGASTEEEGETS